MKFSETSKSLVNGVADIARLAYQEFRGLPSQIQKTVPLLGAICVDMAFTSPNFRESIINTGILGLIEVCYVVRDTILKKNDFSLLSLFKNIIFGNSAYNYSLDHLNIKNNNSITEAARKDESAARYIAPSFFRPIGYLAASTALNINARLSGLEEIWRNNWPAITGFSLATFYLGSCAFKKKQSK